jgi:pimeloyl-ACP methyl ester carboxylesterase
LNPAAPIEVVPHWGCRLEAPHMDEPMGIDLIPRQGVQFRHVSRVGTPRESCSGASTDPAAKRRFQQECASFAERIEREGMPAMAELYCVGTARVQYRDKDPRGWSEFKRQFAEGSAAGHARTMIGVQSRRAPLFERKTELAAIPVPVLVVAGDEDDTTLDVALFLKRTIPRCGLMMLPKTGHTINLEEPAAFNAGVESFLHAVERGRWGISATLTHKSYMLVPQDK